MSKSSLYVKESLAIAERVLGDAFHELQERKADGDVLLIEEFMALKASLAQVERFVWLVAASVEAMDAHKLVKEAN